ncbi:MAG: hypothetical protein FWC62_08680 [Firmicutes bacterium]|nr:hypothetical protein [Bacillota bacterium]
MDYREMYFELLRAQCDALEDLQEIADKLCGLGDRIKIAHLAAEAMLLNEGEKTEVQGT